MAASNDGGCDARATSFQLENVTAADFTSPGDPTEWRLTKLTIVAKAEAHSVGTLCGPARLVAQKIIEMAQSGGARSRQSTLPGTPRVPKR